MTVKSLRHKFQSAITDGGDATLVRPSSNWNDDHDFWLGYRAVTITTDTIAHTDHLSLLTYNNGGGVAVSLPAPSGSNFPLGWYVRLRNLGLGTVTVTGTGGATINGAGSIALAQNDTLDLYSIGTTNYIGVKISPITSVVAVRSINRQRFTASGTYTPTAGMLYCEIECVGGGGGGGGVGDTSPAPGMFLGAGGGGSGGYSSRTVSAATIGASQSVTIGAAGTAGAGSGGGSTGGAGGNTFVGATFGTAICAATGGGGGPGMGAATWIGGSGGSLTGAVGDYTAAGTPGGGVSSYQWTIGVAAAGNGGSSYFGGGGRGAVADINGSSTAGSAGSNYGAGGGGANSSSVPTVRAGGAGAPGVVIITEYIS